MRIWILNHHATAQFDAKGGRHYNFAKFLKARGHEVLVFCASSFHGKSENLINDKALFIEREDGHTHFVFVKTRSYVGNGKSRILGMADYYRNVKKAARYFEKPDVIIGSSVHPLAIAAAESLAKKYKIPAIAEVRDLWPESIVAYNVARKRNPVIKALYMLEKHLYKKADRLIFTMEGAYDYITERGWDRQIPREKVHFINNGVDLEFFDSCAESGGGETAEKTAVDLVYTGSIRRANDLSGLIEAIPLVNAAVKENFRVLLYGDGDYVPQLQARLEELGASNVHFMGRVNKTQIPAVLKAADICYVDGCINTALCRFGMSQNKTFDYLAAGKPIVTPVPDKYDIAVNAGAGLYVENEKTCVANALIKLVNSKELRESMGSLARATAKNYDFAKLTDDLLKVIEGIS